MTYSNVNTVAMLIVLLILILHQNQAQEYVGEHNHSSSTFSDMTPEEQTNELKRFRLEVLELIVPERIKINDMNDYRQIVLPAYSNTNIQLRNMALHAKDIGFALIQVHAFEYNVTLSYTNTIVTGRHLTGTNLGLTLRNDGTLYAINTNPLQDIWISLVLMLYNKTAPIPGGCNMEYPVDISPVMNLTLEESVIEVDTPPASVARRFNTSENQCGKIELKYESYYLSMPTYDFSQYTYFTYIRKLISYASAKASGRLNSLASVHSRIKRVYDRQVGRGMVFVTVAIDPVHHGFSAYVPIQTYACAPFSDMVGCYEFNVPVRILGFIVTLLMAAEIVLGFCPLAVKGFICGAIIGLLGTIKVARDVNIQIGEKELIALLLTASILCALVFVVMAIFCPIAAVIICNFVVGFLLCSIVFYGAYNFSTNLYTHPYAHVFMLGGVIVVGVALNSIKWFLYTNGILFGTICLFYGVNAVFSARLHYSLRSMIRGMWQDDYAAVLSDPTMDTNEIMAIAIFGVIFAICVYVRVRCHLHENRVARLPCVDRGSTTSLAFLADDALAYESVSDYPTITRWTSGDDDVFESPRTNSRFFERLRRRP
ncbi:transmembrane 7 superfamily member 3-like [Toxorhynchites rutilus septentrionalis]|uniref:transmembrane 7 superfamily member 3-like n=1 Tax=Toxorhynchites rutilus septentrionalis TaxID=329112 RepID=UPI0024795993|nr:transmembrane 7 superfamily member 3-like [Toxorhynchites rutilus septentrionalis]